MTNKTMTATKAKTQFAELIETARNEPVTITRNNRPVAVVISPTYYENFASDSKTKRRMNLQELFDEAAFKSGEKDLSQKVDEIVYGS